MDNNFSDETRMGAAGAALLRGTGLSVHQDQFTMVSVSKEQWPELLADNSLSPAGSSPFMIFSDGYEVTLVLNSGDFANIRRAIGGSGVERGFRLLTFTTAMDFSVVGFLAEVSRILAAAGIPIVALSAFSRDHLLIRQDDLAAALKALGPYVEELC